MKRPIIALVLLQLLTGNALADFDFKGIRIGGETDRETIETTLGISCGKGTSKAAICSGKSTIGGERASTLIRIGSTGAVERINVIFSEATFDLIEPEFVKKFGKPKTSRSKVTSAGGASLESVIHTWTSGEGAIISASKNTTTAGEASLMMNTKDDLESLRKSRESRKTDL